MGLMAASASKKEAGRAGHGGGRARGTAAEGVGTDRDKAQMAQFVRLVNGFAARLREIDVAMASVMKRLAG